ncbi:hypothetical protein HNP65_001249 [Thermosipho japonicus]|uniref:Nucleotidyltransferase family protein n=1 Tax=Thermosipho japonicus TaxID=90323 RepID=A0A841GK92_9BACT|nr:hypothetical protein [Thermosipho japonicus]MBB6062797.1 hypothetical protein [Thermosipho japonicus]
MNFYEIERELLDLKHPYPEHKSLKNTFVCILKDESIKPYKLKEFIRLWLTEGVPYVFKDVPYLYERIRSYLASKLGIFPKNMFIIGSARIGYSLDPNCFPKNFGKNSDIDFTIVDDNLFKKLCKDFWGWKDDFENKKCIPKNYREKTYWKKNAKCVPKNIKRGFIDIYKIPACPCYKKRYEFTRIVPGLRELIKKYIGKEYSDKDLSFRIYKNWDSFFKQTELNLRYLGNKFIEVSSNE